MGVVFVAGHRGMVGSALCRRLARDGIETLVAGRDQLDLADQAAVNAFFAKHDIDQVYLAAASVGGIGANDAYPADFIYENLVIQTNVIHAAWRTGVEKLLFLGSSCIYPRLAPQPIPESALLSGPLEPTNQWYAVAKIAGIKLCQAYRRQHGFNAIAVMPTNLYGPGDDFDLETSHVLAALIRKFDDAVRNDAPTVRVWGTGRPRREFLHVDDLADACIFLMQHYDDGDIVNIGWGRDISIAEVAELIAEITGFDGDIAYDRSKPDGTPRKLLDTSRLTDLGWTPSIPLAQGIEATWRWYRANHAAD